MLFMSLQCSESKQAHMYILMLWSYILVSLVGDPTTKSDGICPRSPRSPTFVYFASRGQEMKKIVDMINYEIEYVLRPHTAPARFIIQLSP